MILCLSYEQSNVTRPMDKDHRTANGRRLVRLEDPRLISTSINHPTWILDPIFVRSSRNGDVDWISRQTRSKHLFRSFAISVGTLFSSIETIV